MKGFISGTALIIFAISASLITLTGYSIYKYQEVSEENELIKKELSKKTEEDSVNERAGNLATSTNNSAENYSTEQTISAEEQIPNPISNTDANPRIEEVNTNEHIPTNYFDQISVAYDNEIKGARLIADKSEPIIDFMNNNISLWKNTISMMEKAEYTDEGLLLVFKDVLNLRVQRRDDALATLNRIQDYIALIESERKRYSNTLVDHQTATAILDDIKNADSNNNSAQAMNDHLTGYVGWLEKISTEYINYIDDATSIRIPTHHPELRIPQISSSYCDIGYNTISCSSYTF